MTGPTPLLATQDLAVGYRQGHRSARVVLQELCLELRSGELVCLLGANGIGKTTLLRTLAGMSTPLAGEIHLRGRSLTSYTPHELARMRSVVLTERIGGAMLKARALVALGRHPYTDWRGQLRPQDQAAVAEAIRLVGAEELAPRYFNQLSDGERQKLLIARALAQEPTLLLLDEPTAFLDLPRRVEIMLLLRRLTRKTGCAILLATHDLDAALRVADSFWLIGQDGKISVDIPENIVLNGQLENAFLDTDLRFNYQSGAFEHPLGIEPSIFVRGKGRIYEWTCRALRRLGYTIETIEEDPHIPIVTIDETTETPTWRWEYLGNTSEYYKLSTFLDEATEKYRAASPCKSEDWQDKILLS